MKNINMYKEFPVEGMQNDTKSGFVDYVLLGRNKYMQIV